MRILVTGNQGYIGSVLVPLLQEQGHHVVGYDIGYYAQCLLLPLNTDLQQITKDIRAISDQDLQGVEVVIHLAGLSNDPLGELSPGLTEEINLGGTLRLADAAQRMGVRRLIYASSQSMYGISNVERELDEDDSEKHPVTAYARTKWEAECKLKELQTTDFTVVCFRPSSVFGASPRLRCDIVFNNLVACAYTTGRIEIKSDGTPWRPVVHVRDVCAAFIAGLNAPTDLVAGRSYNVGIPNGNFTVRDLAEAAQRVVAGSELTFTGERGQDSRTYRVSFQRILTELKDYYQPEWDLDCGGKELVAFFDRVGFAEKEFRGRTTNRLAQLKHFMKSRSGTQGSISSFSETLQSCRICSSPRIEVILDLGAQPPANSLRERREEALPVVPLVLCRCASCGTVQLTETVSPGYLFSHYFWVTGTSKGAQDYSRVFFERLASRSKQGRLFVAEVASNDGTFLKPFQERGDKVLGIDAARNIAAIASVAGIPTIAEFFGSEVAQQIVAEHGNADIVFGRNVIPHVANANDVVAGIAHCLKPDGTGAIEFHRADVILEDLHYDSIYHEHLFYHSLHSIRLLLDRFGLRLFDVTESPISGGSLVAYFAKAPRTPTDALKKTLEHEAALGIGNARPWREFAIRCEQHRGALRGLVEQTKVKGKRLIGYGASARSSTLLNYCGIDNRHLEVVADKNTLKHGRYTPGTDIPIVAPERAFADRPDTVLLLAWNFREEILAQIKADYGWWGEVIVPLPGDPVVIRI